MLQRRPNTFAQTNLLSQFFACDKAADHTFRLADTREFCDDTSIYRELSTRLAFATWPFRA